MVPERVRALDARAARGFTLAELLAVIAMIGVLSVLAAPSLISYWQVSTLQAGAEELAAAVNRGRHLAISRNTTVCAQVSGTAITLRTGGCAGTVFTGIGTTAAGLIRLTGGMQVSFASGASIVFTNLGAASTAATLRVTHPATGKTRDVVVSAAGQVRVQ
ncbi:MAG TPA: hypothetical protein DDZ42_20500 [Candidatus Rokubacteria bacterium]|nr:MAG: hypothetical protein A2050_15410 [Candidatus Rokubacteria bacterium GWA2_73_35]HBH04260.1 hypothetical protein [Candidatus Rokubacteria bacterium]